MKKLISALAAAAVAMGAAHAAPITFYTTNAGHYYDGVGSKHGGSQTYEKHGLTMWVSGAVYDDSDPQEITGDAPTQVWSNGTGIDRGWSDGHLVDGNKTNEAVVLKFDHAVKLIAAKFTYVDGPDSYSDGDDIDIFVEDKDDLGELIFHSGEWDIHSGNNPFYFEQQLNTALIGNIFGIGADGKNDGWKLKWVKVEKHIPEVPVPAALPLFLAGLGALGWAKRKRKAA